MREIDWSNWVTKERLDGLSESDREDYLHRQRMKGQVTIKTNQIERLKKKLEVEKENLKSIKYQFERSNKKFVTIFDTLYYSVSISCNRYRYIDRTKVKNPRISDKRKVSNPELEDNLHEKMYGKFKVEKKEPTYSVTINLKRHDRPKNIYLGTEKKIKQRLVDFYKDDIWKTKNWKIELRNRVNGRSVDDFIFNEIQKGWENFKDKKITLDDLYKLKVSIPLMITKKMKVKLSEYGFTEKQIKDMTPEDGHWNIKMGNKFDDINERMNKMKERGFDEDGNFRK